MSVTAHAPSAWYIRRWCSGRREPRGRAATAPARRASEQGDPSATQRQPRTGRAMPSASPPSEEARTRPRPRSARRRGFAGTPSISASVRSPRRASSSS